MSELARIGAISTVRTEYHEHSRVVFDSVLQCSYDCDENNLGLKESPPLWTVAVF